jgi:hypothetical protein
VDKYVVATAQGLFLTAGGTAPLVPVCAVKHIADVAMLASQRLLFLLAGAAQGSGSHV